MRVGSDPEQTETAATEDVRSETAKRADARARVSDRYTVVEETARGGIGRVLRAKDHNLDREIAIKELLRPGGVAEERFQREAKITARLQHPGIVPIYERGRWHNGEPYYAMKMVAGRSLKELIDEAKTADERLKLLVNVQAIADTIAYAHSEGIIHRDLKPSNVIVGEFGETVVIDWGLAKDKKDVVEPEPAGDPYRCASAPALTGTGAVLGTPRYMAPEQAAGGAVDEAADIYAIGGILYHLIVGAPPNAGDSSADVVKRLKRGELPELDEQSGVRGALRSVVLRAMAQQPRDRYPSASSLAKDLRAFQAGRRVTSHSYTLRDRAMLFYRRNRLLTIGASAALLAIAVISVVSIKRVLAERDHANSARLAADAAKTRTALALTQVEDERDNLILVQARSALSTDPTRSLGWAKKYDGSAGLEVQEIVARAQGLGVATHVFPAHRFPPRTLLFAPGGKRLLSESADGLIVEWALDASTRRVLASDLSERAISAFASDATRVWYVNEQNQVIELDVGTGAKKPLGTGEGFLRVLRSDGRILTTHKSRELIEWREGRKRSIYTGRAPLWVAAATSEASTVVACEEGKLIALGRTQSAGRCDSRVYLSGDGNAALAATQDSLWILQERWREVSSLSHTPWRLALSSNGGKIAYGSRLGEVAVRDYRLPEKDSWRRALHTQVTALQLSDDGDLLAVGVSTGDVFLFDHSGAQLAQLRGHVGRIDVMVFDGSSRLATGGVDGIRVWSLDDLLHDVWQLSPHSVFHVVISPDGLEVAVDGQGLVARREWDGLDFEMSYEQRAPVFGLSWTNDGTLLSASWDGTVGVWPRGGAPRRLAGHVDIVRSVAAISDSSFASGGVDGTVRVWSSAGDSTILGRLPRETHRVEVNGSGTRVAAVGSDGTLAVWDLASRAEAARVKCHVGRINSVTWSTDGERLLTAGSDGRVVESDGKACTELHVFASSAEEAQWSDDGAVAACSAAGDIWYRDTNGSRVVATSSGRIRDLAFSADAKHLALGSADGSVRVVDLEDWTLAVLSGHSGGVNGVAIPGADEVLSTSNDGTLRRWTGLRRTPTRVDEVQLYVKELTTVTINERGGFLPPEDTKPGEKK